MQAPHLLNDNTISHTIQKCVVIAAVINNTTIFTYSLYNTFCRKNRKLYHKLSIQWISILSLLSSVVVSVGAALVTFPFYSPPRCNIIVDICVISYIWFKAAMYTFLIERFRLVVKTHISVKLISISICIWMILMSISVFLLHNAYFDQRINTCVLNYHFSFAISLAISDSVIGTTIVIMLFKAVLSISTNGIQDCGVELESQSKERIITNVNDNNLKLKRLIKRLLVLSLISVITTQLFYVMAIVLGLGAMFGALDTIINGWCIVLTFVTTKNSDNRKQKQLNVTPPISVVDTTCQTETVIMVKPKLVRDCVSAFNLSNTIGYDQGI